MPNDLVVVFDTNVVIPMIIPASRSARLFIRLQAADIKVAISWPILAEVRDKLRGKAGLRKWLGVPDERIDRFLRRLPTVCFVASGKRIAHGAVPADPKDDMVIAAALGSFAQRYVNSHRNSY